eukprot:gnl/MRDRNA2_/MRDRNA2_162321_c0_seq1.p1 gnl/MRDRNA2_/MRDRNA2_162321_c0~~gnl/MRDRNA2_/MRDRNA2_162321_c0_seq1.p1  ORF type:complete len:489 (+),score=125.14 gnl/MRDRNA2_/MRDRNA2_162321_c0_seq1:161-1468(+)
MRAAFGTPGQALGVRKPKATLPGFVCASAPRYGWINPSASSDPGEIPRKHAEDDRQVEVTDKAALSSTKLEEAYGLGFKFLRKMGYKEGEGLGKERQGRAIPLMPAGNVKFQVETAWPTQWPGFAAGAAQTAAGDPKPSSNTSNQKQERLFLEHVARAEVLGAVEQLSQGVDVNCCDSESGDTALHICARAGLARVSLEMLEMLLQYPRTNVHQLNLYGEAALFVAVSKGHKDVAKCLLAVKADPALATGKAQITCSPEEQKHFTLPSPPKTTKTLPSLTISAPQRKKWLPEKISYPKIHDAQSKKRDLEKISYSSDEDDVEEAELLDNVVPVVLDPRSRPIVKRSTEKKKQAPQVNDFREQAGIKSGRALDAKKAKKQKRMNEPSKATSSWAAFLTDLESEQTVDTKKDKKPKKASERGKAPLSRDSLLIELDD